MIQIGVRTLLVSLSVTLLGLVSATWADPMLVRVPMGDGTLLATDIHLPKGDGPWPTILLRSTYGRMGAVAKEWLDQRYAVVIQDVRGMGDSKGDAHVFYADGWREGLRDGADTVDWIQAQDWCNGKIGTWGGSALAITEMLLAPTTPDLHPSPSIQKTLRHRRGVTESGKNVGQGRIGRCFGFAS